MDSEEELIKNIQKRTFLSEADLKDSFLRSREFKEKRAKDGADLERIAGDDVMLLKEALSAYSEAMLSEDRNRILEKILKVAPDDPYAVSARVGTLVARSQAAGTLREDLEMLIAEYSKLYEYSDLTTSADKSISFILYECGEYERALPYFKRLALDDLAILDRLAHSLYETGRFRDAFELFQSRSFLDFSQKNRERCADVLEMFGKTRQARRLRFSLEQLNLAAEMQAAYQAEPDVIRKHTKMGANEFEVLSTLYNPRNVNKLSYEEAVAKMNFALRPISQKQFNVEEIMEIEESALKILGVTGAQYHQIVSHYYRTVQLPRQDEHNRRLQLILHEKYPDLLESDSTDDDD